jgi:hypothetical protein
MDTINYLGHKIVYVPLRESCNSLEDKTDLFLIFKDGEKKAELQFVIPMPKSFAFGQNIDELKNLEVNKTKEIIAQGFGNNPHKEFELTETGFDEVIES